MFGYRNLGFGSGGVAAEVAFSIPYSMRFNDADNPYLTRSVDTEGNRKTWTYSAWVKRSNLTGSDDEVTLFDVWSNGDNWERIIIDANDAFMVQARVANSNQYYKFTNTLLRDPAAWYHLMCVVDTTDSTASDRVKMYINGVRETSFSASGDPAEDLEVWVNNGTTTNIIGDAQDTNMQGYLAEIHFVDGTALTPATFGEA